MIEHTFDSIIDKLNSDINNKPNFPYRVYFAGKIDKNDWRHTLIDFPREWDWQDTPSEFVVNDRIIYSGPYFVACDHGCYHGPGTHGRGAGSRYVCDFTETRKEVFDRCCSNIDDSDVVFCYLDSMDAYGTLWELGYAFNSKKHIFVACKSDEFPPTVFRELWFVLSGCNKVVFAFDESDAFSQFNKYLETAYLGKVSKVGTPKQVWYVCSLLKNNFDIQVTPTQRHTLETMPQGKIGKLISILLSESSL